MAWPYCKGDQFTTFVDVRVARQLLSDDPAVDVPEADVPTHPLLKEALKEGATELDQALTEHLRLSVPVLMRLAEVRPDGEPDPGVWLRKMNAARAVVALQHRRVRPSPEAKQLAAELIDWSDRQLELVHSGHNILPPTLAASVGMATDAEARGALEANQGADLVERVTFDPSGNPLLHPRMFPSSTNPNYVDPLNQDYRNGL
jgi:hypothetical protein